MIVLLYRIGTLLETDFHQREKNIEEMLKMSKRKLFIESQHVLMF